MRKWKDIFKNKKQRVLIGTIAAVAAVSVLAIGIGATLAGSNDIVKTFERTNTYSLIRYNAKVPVYEGAFKAIPSDRAMLDGEVTDGIASVITKNISGVASVAFMTFSGSTRVNSYQIYDESGISGYRIPLGQMHIDAVSGENAAISVTVKTSAGELTTADWNELNPDNKIVWESQHKDIVEVVGEDAIKALKSGSAVLIGSVIDKWGLLRQIPFLVTVAEAVAQTPEATVGAATPVPTPFEVTESPDAEQ